jgi:PAS domain S-box-containing protein
MHPVAYFDVISFAFSLAALILLFKGWHRALERDVKLLLAGLFTLTAFYSVCLFTEWTGMTAALDPFEDLIGAMMPMWWAFIFYSFLQHIDRSHRKSAETALRKSEERYRNFIENAPIGMYTINTEGEFTYANKRLFELTGYKEEDWLNKPYSTLLHPDDLPIVTEKIRNRIVGHGTPEPYEIRIYDASGDVMWAKIFSESIYGKTESGEKILVGMQSFLEDITDRKKAEEALKGEKERFQVLVEESPFGIALINQEDVYKYINPKFVEIFGYTLADIPTKREWFKKAYGIKEFRDQAESSWADDINKLGGGESEPRTFTVRCKDGSEKMVYFKLVTMKNRDKFVICEDMTIAIRLEEQLRQSQKMQAIGTLAGGIAHDFNNILFPITGFTELILEETPKDSPIRDNLNHILKASKRARDLVNQILTFSRQVDQEIRPVDVKLVIKEVLKLIRPSLPATIEIRHHLIDDCGLVMADPTQIHQVAMNLITNAYHAMQETGGRLDISLQAMELKNEDVKTSPLNPGSYVCLSVSDTGYGMEKTVMDKIFDPYFTTKEKGKGTGLGMAVVHGIVESHGGDIRVDSEPGKGTLVKVYLPMLEPVLEAGEKEPYAQIMKGNERILLVDDEEEVIKLECKMLDYFGYRVTTQTGSLAALEAFRKSPFAYDLIITDMTMPKMTGLQLSRKVKEIRTDIPVILCTGFSEQVNEKNAEASGIQGFILKPVLMNEFSELIRRVLDNNK